MARTGLLSAALAFVAERTNRIGALPRTAKRRVMFGVASCLALGIAPLMIPVLAGGSGQPQRWVSAPDPAGSASAVQTIIATVDGPPPLLRAGPVSVTVQGWYAWALLDRTTGEISGSANMTSTNTTASMIKAWIAADYLRLDPNPSQARLDQISDMIRNSDNDAAEDLFLSLGKQASIDRLIDRCGLHETSSYQGFWSNTNVSARDAVLMGQCIADGRAAGAKWTDWLLNEMRHTVDLGRAGITQALPDAVADTVAVKNGWVTRDSVKEWHVNCLAIGDTWILAVENRYPESLGVSYGFETCRSVAEQLMQH
jgi:hypothetical protein